MGKAGEAGLAELDFEEVTKEAGKSQRYYYGQDGTRRHD